LNGADAKKMMSAFYRGQEKEFHHEEHKEHEEGKETLLLSTLCYSSSLRVRAFLRGFIFLNSIYYGSNVRHNGCKASQPHVTVSHNRCNVAFRHANVNHNRINASYHRVNGFYNGVILRQNPVNVNATRVNVSHNRLIAGFV
jgi:hypothetical protein